VPTYGIINVGTGAQPVWYGNPDNPSPFTIANISASANIWLGSNQSIGPANPNESTVITPGGYLSLDGSQSVYYVVADAANGEVTIYPGVTSYFLPVSLSGLGGASVYQQPTAPTGIIPPGSLWINTTTKGIEIYMGGAWNPVQFNAASLLEVQTVVATLIAAGTIVAGIVNGTTIEGAQFIAYGSTGEILIYSGTPAAGNLIGSWSGASGTDPDGNTYTASLTVGVAANPQISLIPGNPAKLVFPIPPAAFFSNFPNLSVTNPANNSVFVISGGSLAQSGFTDFVQSVLYSNTAGTPAHWDERYVDANGNPHLMFTFGADGCQMVASQISAVTPGTGTSNTNAATPAGWINGTSSLLNSWASSGESPNGVNGFFYRLLPLGTSGTVEIIADIINASAIGNSVIFDLPSGYWPAFNQNHSTGWNNPGSTSPPWVNVNTAGTVELYGIETADKATFFHIFVPLESL
jgi:hypothetical protein